MDQVKQAFDHVMTFLTPQLPIRKLVDQFWIQATR
jgi:hypothetical protein